MPRQSKSKLFINIQFFKVNLEIITPEKKLYEGKVDLVKVPGTKGPFTILRNHAPIISTLEKGTIRIVNKKNETSYIEILGGMSQAAVEDATLAVMSRPGYRHYASLDPGEMFAVKGGSCQDLVGRIDVQVVLLGFHFKVIYSGGNRMFMIDDVDLIPDYAAGMFDPLTTGHEVVACVFRKGGGHSAMPSSQAGA